MVKWCVYLTVIIFDADDRYWLFACGLMSVHSASQDTHMHSNAYADTHTDAGMERAEWFPLNAINPLDSFNKSLEMFCVQKKKVRARCTCNYCTVILKL